MTLRDCTPSPTASYTSARSSHSAGIADAPTAPQHLPPCCLARGHDRRVFGDMVDTSSLHGIGLQGGHPCHGERCRLWSSDASLYGSRCRKERIGGSCADGSGFSPDTGYEWLDRFAGGDTALADRSRRPHAAPCAAEAAIEERSLQRARGPSGLGRAQDREVILHAMGRVHPAASTVHAILQRHGLVIRPPGGGRRAAAALREGGSQPALADGFQRLGAAQPMACVAIP